MNEINREEIIKTDQFDRDLLDQLLKTYERQTLAVLSEMKKLSFDNTEALKQKVHLLQGSTRYFYEGPLIQELDVFLKAPNIELLNSLESHFINLIERLKNY